MNILIVDDDADRVVEIIQVLSEDLSISRESISFCYTADAAKNLLRSKYFDVLVLDVSLPKRKGDVPLFVNGLNLLEQIARRPIYNKPEKIIGITAHVSDIGTLQKDFSVYCLAIIEASNKDRLWKKHLVDSVRYTSSSMLSRAFTNKKLSVLSVHGIGSFGNWQQIFKSEIEKEYNDIHFQSYKYGYFTFLAFFLPFMRNLQVRNFSKKLLKCIESNPDHKIIIYSHSFGTYIVTNAIRNLLKKECILPIDKLILSGSVLPSNYDWGQISSKIKCKIINDCGNNDYVLWLSEAFVPFTGMAGKIGFYGLNNDDFINRFFSGGHGLYFKNNHIRKYWIPLIYNNKIELIDNRVPSFIMHGVLDKVIGLIGKFKEIIYFIVIPYLIFK